MTYKQTCIDHIETSLNDLVGYDVEISELGMTLTEGENANGSWYCSTYKAEQDLKNWFDDVGDFIEEYEDEYGTKPEHDAFTQPELFHCLMMIVGVEKLINQSETVDKLWGKNIKLTKKIADKIIDDVKNLK